MLLVVTYSKASRSAVLKLQTKSENYDSRVETRIIRTGQNNNYSTPEFNINNT